VRSLRQEIRPMLALAVPVVLAEIGWVAMGIVDTIFVGRLGPAAIGAVGLGSILFLALATFGMGLLLGLDTLVSQSFGAGNLADCHRWLLQGIYLALLVALPLGGFAWLLIATLPRWGLEADVLRLASPYLTIVFWSLLPLLLYAACRRYLQAMGIVAPVTFVLVSANVINAVANWLLVFGHMGLPALGTDGSALATLASRIYMVIVMVVAIVRYDVQHHVSLFSIPRQLEWPAIRRLVGLGLPAASQVTLEIGVFAAATALAGRLDAISLASHQVTLNLSSLTFMVPLGLASAGAIRVGHAIGRRDGPGAAIAGWTALALGASFMAVAGLTFALLPRPLLRVFTANAHVIATGTSLLLVAAMFQLFDGLQGVSTGVLRGLGDTRTPMLTNLAGHWLLGLPAGYALCFVARWGVVGLWVGLSIGLTSVGLTLVSVWWGRARALRGLHGS
jgi:MATE family multidrug resistance protein